jgi:hypothetical protein
MHSQYCHEVETDISVAQSAFFGLQSDTLSIFLFAIDLSLKEKFPLRLWVPFSLETGGVIL